MKINNTNELSSFLKYQRKSNQRSQVNVASKIGVQQQTISAFERNSNHSKIETLFKILNELNLEFHIENKPLPTNNHKKNDDDWQEEW